MGDGLLDSGRPSRVVGLGAICDPGVPGPDEHSQHFLVSEFILLDNGHRVILHADRGFTIGSGTKAIQDYLTLDGITRDVLNVVLPDDDTP